MLDGREDKNGSVAEMTRRMQPNRRALDLLIRPTHVEIDLAALEKNVSLARRMSPGGQLMVVVKAHAYGHGAILVARSLQPARRQLLRVALPDEGLRVPKPRLPTPHPLLGGPAQTPLCP